ncbi:hypothetical protein FDECE_5253 [Fusarium decemcellulare]|nr:hypothetical protein FDECE_5253 [Fusarium decemcellulare]
MMPDLSPKQDPTLECPTPRTTASRGQCADTACKKDIGRRRTMSKLGPGQSGYQLAEQVRGLCDSFNKLAVLHMASQDRNQNLCDRLDTLQNLLQGILDNLTYQLYCNQGTYDQFVTPRHLSNMSNLPRLQCYPAMKDSAASAVGDNTTDSTDFGNSSHFIGPQLEASRDFHMREDQLNGTQPQANIGDLYYGHNQQEEATQCSPPSQALN